MNEVCGYRSNRTNLFDTAKFRNRNEYHVYVYYGEYEASVGLDGEVLEGRLPQKQYRILAGWMAIHEDELYAAWNNAVRNLPFDRIDPLQ